MIFAAESALKASMSESLLDNAPGVRCSIRQWRPVSSKDTNSYTIEIAI
jgi:hypothetical protein